MTVEQFETLPWCDWCDNPEDECSCPEPDPAVLAEIFRKLRS